MRLRSSRKKQTRRSRATKRAVGVVPSIVARDYALLKKCRQALYEDARVHRKRKWSALEWEERALSAHSDMVSVIGLKELDIIMRMAWRLAPPPHLRK